MALPLTSCVLIAKCSLAALLLVLVLSSSPAACNAAQQNITAILAAHPDLHEFSTVLTSTRLADDISKRSDRTLTVLAVNDAGMESLKNLPREAVWGNLSLHVLLDCYYDDAKLRRLPFGDRTLVSTLYSDAGGGTPGAFGMVEIVKFSDERGVGFLPMGSHGGKPAFFVKSVYGAFPYSMSVLQVSGVMTPGIPDDATDGDAAGDENNHDGGTAPLN